MVTPPTVGLVETPVVTPRMERLYRPLASGLRDKPGTE